MSRTSPPPTASPSQRSRANPAVVAVTPMAVERDTRTYQIAASLRRFGYDSTVVEGEPSNLAREGLPFRLITVRDAQPLREVEDQAPTGPAADSGAQATASASHPLLEAMPKPIAAAIKWLGARLLRLRGRLTNWWRLPLMLRQSFNLDNERTRESLPPAELYYLTYFWQFPAVWSACRRTGAEFVYDANDAYWAWPSYQWYPALFRLMLRLIEGRCVRRARHFVTVSEGVANLLERRYGRRPVVVRNVHDLRVDEETTLDVRRASGLGTDAFLLVIAGNDKPSDAVSEAIQALKMLPDRVHLALMGRGYEKRPPEVRELGLEDRVHLLPPVPPTEVTSAIETADASLINIRASDIHIHALPTRLFHSVSAGLPVLYPPLPEVRALAEEHHLGLQIDAENSESIAAAVLRLIESPELIADFRANAERARKVLNWEREESLLAEMVESAIGNPT